MIIIKFSCKKLFLNCKLSENVFLYFKFIFFRAHFMTSGWQSYLTVRFPSVDIVCLLKISLSPKKVLYNCCTSEINCHKGIIFFHSSLCPSVMLSFYWHHINSMEHWVCKQSGSFLEKEGGLLWWCRGVKQVLCKSINVIDKHKKSSHRQ